MGGIIFGLRHFVARLRGRFKPCNRCNHCANRTHLTEFYFDEKGKDLGLKCRHINARAPRWDELCEGYKTAVV